ncbi:MAG: phosphotransferase [Actinopolymorphaceae bacterium]
MSTESSEYGFSPGFAARVVLANGDRRFLKVGGPVPEPKTVEFHRGEARLAGALPADLPAPRLLDVYDTDGWIGLVYEEIAGRNPALPWSCADLDVVVAAIARLAERVTPVPDAVVPVVSRLNFDPRGWYRLADDPELLSRIDDPFVRHELSALTDLEARAGRAAAGDTLLHLDIRADNVLLTDTGPVFVDWAQARIGAGWVDLLLFVPSVAMQGGPEPWEVFDGHELATGVAADDVSAMVCALAGFYLERGLRAAAPGRTAVRRFQYVQGLKALDWLKARIA